MSHNFVWFTPWNFHPSPPPPKKEKKLTPCPTPLHPTVPTCCIIHLEWIGLQVAWIQNQTSPIRPHATSVLDHVHHLLSPNAAVFWLCCS